MNPPKGSGRMLKLLAVIIGALILLVVFLKTSAIGIGTRTNHNVLTDQIANVAVSTWLLLILIVIEVLVIFALVVSRGGPYLHENQ